MKIHFKKSVKQRLDELFGTGIAQDIDFMELSESEYISLLEELPPIGRVLIVDTDTKYRVYKGIRLKVLR